MRVLNARMWGHSTDPAARDASDPVKLGGCGRIAEGGSWVPVYDTGERWSPGSLATCDSTMLCDYCGPREQAESKARYSWHFNDWTQGGGQLLHLRLSFAHGRGDDLAPMLDDLKTAFERLRRSKAWLDAGIVEWVRVLHIRWSPDTGFYPHYHVVGLVDANHPLNTERATLELQAAWRDRVAKGIGRRVSQRHGLFARVVGSAWGALYAWHWADPDERDAQAERTDTHRDDLGADYEPRHLDDDDGDDRGSWPLYRLAEAALDGDEVAWCAWMELCRAMKGVPVVRCSQLLTKAWKAYQAEQPAPDAPELGEPVVTVGATLWERARRAGATEMALAIGRTMGVEAMAQWWHERLGVTVLLEESCPPRLFIRAGPRAADPSLN